MDMQFRMLHLGQQWIWTLALGWMAMSDCGQAIPQGDQHGVGDPLLAELLRNAACGSARGTILRVAPHHFAAVLREPDQACSPPRQLPQQSSRLRAYEIV